MKIIDTFIFYNEIEILQARLMELYNIVDYFILVEGTLTFTGNKKPLYYNDNKELFSKYNDKIIHIIVDDFPETTNPWDRERHQRRCINRGIEKLELLDDDIIIISDVDEIPNSDIINSIKIKSIIIDSAHVYALIMTLYYYTINWTVSNKWDYVKVITNSKYESIKDTERIRLFCPYIPIDNGGWHISYYGDANFIINKIESFSEQAYNTDIYKNKERLNNCINDGTLWFCNQPLLKNNNYEYLPKYFKELITN